MEKDYQKTMYACFVGYVVQAIVNNFVPLLFLTFHETYGIPLAKITFLVTINFGIQLCVDLLSVTFVDRIGYRASMILAHVTSSLGLILLAVLPGVLPDPYVGILAAVVVYAVGGGLLEVIVSPVMEACPTPNKEAAMSLLHSFYCWGHVGVVLISTAFFAVFGISNWRILAVCWALIPAANMLAFTRVPIARLIQEDEKEMPLGTTGSSPVGAYEKLVEWYEADGLDFSAGGQPVGLNVRGAGAGREQDDRRSGRSHVLCHPDGNLPRDLRKIRRQDSAGKIYFRKRSAVPRVLPDHLPVAGSGGRSDRLRSVRPLGRDPVAGNLFHGVGRHTDGRDRAVRTACPGRRYRLFRRSDVCGTDFQRAGQ